MKGIVMVIAIAVLATVCLCACSTTYTPPSTPKPTTAVTAAPTAEPTQAPVITAKPAPVQTAAPKVETVTKPQYEIITEEEYGAANARGKSYRIVVSKDITDAQLKMIYGELRGAGETTIWCYSSASKTDDVYDVAMIEGTGANATITRR